MSKVNQIRNRYYNHQKYTLDNEKKQLKAEIKALNDRIETRAEEGHKYIHTEYDNNLNGMALYFGVREYFIREGFFVDVNCEPEQSGKVALEIKW